MLTDESIFSHIEIDGKTITGKIGDSRHYLTDPKYSHLFK